MVVLIYISLMDHLFICLFAIFFAGISIKVFGPFLNHIFFFNFLYFFLLNFLFCIGIWPIINVVIDSGGQQRDSAIHTCIHSPPNSPSIQAAFQIGFYHLGICLLAFLSHNVRQSSPCYIGPYWLPILNIVVCTCPSQTP